jgi:hypothetical protein
LSVGRRTKKGEEKAPESNSVPYLVFFEIGVVESSVVLSLENLLSKEIQIAGRHLPRDLKASPEPGEAFDWEIVGQSWDPQQRPGR